jgi:hypothetical protein
MRSRKVEKWQRISGLCRVNDDLGIGWRAHEGSHGILFSGADVNSGMNVGKQLKVKLGMRKRLVSERQPRWHQERVGIRTGGSGLEDNENASKRTAVGLVLPGGLLSTAVEHRREFAVNRTDDIGRVVFAVKRLASYMRLAL